ncbi:hypothetical protein ABZ470_23580 [Streptosporangium sp. NPDC020072]|uniref:hypothetical protein n=1 Tax=Streptosporangium sp. NPDC020072 TaxID=3154788 RepID=UPI0034370F20
MLAIRPFLPGPRAFLAVRPSLARPRVLAVRPFLASSWILLAVPPLLPASRMSTVRPLLSGSQTPRAVRSLLPASWTILSRRPFLTGSRVPLSVRSRLTAFPGFLAVRSLLASPVAGGLLAVRRCPSARSAVRSALALGALTSVGTGAGDASVPAGLGILEHLGGVRTPVRASLWASV